MQLLSMASNHHDSQGSGYGQQHWMGMGGYPTTSQSSTGSMQEYHPGDYYVPPAMPMEPAYNMPRPPPPYSSSHALPPPLIMPHNTLWPSMLTSQSNYQTPILPAAPNHTPVSATTAHTPSDVTPTSAKSTTSRRKLTDDERRQMCVEAQQNPGIKQTQIGVKFNVERSTVSKILRQKDKYLNAIPKDESTSPVKKSKVKFPDIERALVNWVRNEQKKGVAITDDKLKKQARFFATTSPSSESQQQITSSAWLENFKKKNLANSGPRKGKASLSPIIDDVIIVDSSTTSLSETPIDDSPTSSGFVSPSISPDEDALRAGVKGERSDDFFDYDGKDPYDDSNSLEHVLSSDLDVSNAILSPISLEMRASSATIESSPAFASNFNRQRAQTFPITESDADALSRPPSSGRTTPAVPIRSMTTTIDTRPTSVNPMHTVKRHKSVSDIHEAEVIHYSSMKPPPIPRSLDNSPTSPGSPTPEEARQALHILKHFFQAQQTDVVDEDDYIMIGKLMGKLKQLKLMRRPSESDLLPGGMHQLDMFDNPRLSKKRTIMGIST